LLVIVNILVGDNAVSNFFLGMVSAVIALATKKYFDSDVASLVGSFLFGMLLIPYFGYLFWYAVIGARTVPASVATNYLVDYVNRNFISSLPSTFAGGFGAWLIEALEHF
jgi:hypothetical protein